MMALDITNCCYCSTGSEWKWRILDPPGMSPWKHVDCRLLEVSSGQAMPGPGLCPAGLASCSDLHPLVIGWSYDIEWATHQRCGSRMERIETDEPIEVARKHIMVKAEGTTGHDLFCGRGVWTGQWATPMVAISSRLASVAAGSRMGQAIFLFVVLILLKRILCYLSNILYQ